MEYRMSDDSFQLPKSTSRRRKKSQTVEVLPSQNTNRKQGGGLSLRGKNGQLDLTGDQVGRVIERGFDNIGAVVKVAKGRSSRKI